MQFSYWLIIVGATGLYRPEGERELGWVWLGVGLVPFVFLALAFGSLHPRASGGVLKALGLFLVVGLPLGVLGPALGIPAGFAVGGAFALRPLEDHPHMLRARLIAVAAGLLYLGILWVIVPLFAVYVGAILPFAVLGLADQAMVWRAREQGVG
jgi:hypothetical protein